MVAAFLATVVFLVWKSREAPVVYDTETPVVTDIVKKTVATGAIVPRTEVEIKSRVSGVLDQLEVEPGEHVEEGALIATIQIIPDLQTLNSAESAVTSAKIALDENEEELRRALDLAERSAISTRELQNAKTNHRLAEQEYRAAVRNLRIVREGSAGGSAQVSTEVRSTVSGMVLAVDVKEGESVTETNTFNAGTTIASVADMTDMIFEGQVDESEVGRIEEGMPLRIQVGALPDRVFDGTLEYIAPKGVLAEGAVQFEIRAAIEAQSDVFIRAGVSANADIVLERRDQVLAVRESVLQFDEGEVYVDVEVGPQSFERREVEVGLSDGIHIEVTGGLEPNTRVKAGVSGV